MGEHASRSEKDAVGYDAGKTVKGRKIHALVDVEGLPLRVIVHSAGTQDRDGAALVLDTIRKRFPWLELVWADAGYNARQVKDAVARSPGLRLEIVKRTDDIKGFVVLPRRWVVERTFSWFARNRRIAKDYENLTDTLAAFVTLAAIQFAVRRLARVRLSEPIRRDLESLESFVIQRRRSDSERDRRCGRRKIVGVTTAAGFATPVI